jgi:P27 family predicted phage terminase small subunit
MAKGRPVDPTAVGRSASHRPEAVRPPAGLSVAAVPLPDALTPPEGLAQDAHDLWRVAVEELCSLRTLHASDLPLLEMMVMAAYRHRQARSQIDALGMLVKGQRGPMVNPLLKVERDEAATYLRLAETLGLTPVARLRLGLITLAGASILAGIDAELGIEVKL